MSGITKADLVRFANSPDAELRFRKDAETTVDTQEASWHGRLGRFLKVNFGGEFWRDQRDDSRKEYAEVEKAVYSALESAYGEKIAKSAFRSVVDHDGGVERTHSDYPLTSRQVRQMVKLAEREIGREPEGPIRQPHSLTMADLQALALTGDSELRGSAGGGIIARKGREGTDHELDYHPGKQSVLEALTDAHGSEVAKHAFVHGVDGRLNARGFVEVPRDEPLRGSQIRKMLDYADVLVSRYETRDLQVRHPSQRDLTTRDLPNVIDARVTEAANLEWMRCIREGLDTPEARLWQAERERLHQIQGNQDSFHGDIKSSRFNQTYGDRPLAAKWPPVAEVRGQPIGFAGVSQVTQGLTEDLPDRLLDNTDQHAFWTLDIGLTKPFRDGGSHQTIAIHVDREDPDTIHVFDANRREARVPRAMFDSWLAAHLSQVYGDDIKHLSLHRMEAKYLGLYDDKDDTYQCNKTIELADHDKYQQQFIRQLEGGMEKNANNLVDHGNGIELSRAFDDDVGRTDTRVVIDGELISLTAENAPTMLKELVASGDGEADKVAVKELSIVLNQGLLNAVGYMVDVVGVGNGNVLTRAQDKDTVELEARRVKDKDGKEYIDITCRNRSAISQLDVEDFAFQVDRNKNTLSSECTLRIALDDLRQDGGHLQYTFIQPPRCSLHLESPKTPGDDTIEEVLQQPRWQTHITFSAHDDQMIAPLSNKRLEVIEQQCRSRVHDADGRMPQQDLELSSMASGQLSRLTQPNNFLPLYQRIAHDVTGRGVDAPPGEVNISSKLTKDGEAVDVEFRYPMPDGFPGNDTVFHSFGFDAPHRDGKFDLTLRLRIPMSELENGRPDSFVLIGGPYIQQHGLSFGAGIGADVNQGAIHEWMRRVDAGEGPLTGAEWRAQHERLLRITDEGQKADEAFRDMRFDAETSLRTGNPLNDPSTKSVVAGALLDDMMQRFDDEPWQDHAFWMVDLKLTDDFANGGVSQTIGFHVDRSDPGMIHVFDANHCEIRVPREDFSNWLNAHLTTVYGEKIDQLSLQRVEQKGIKNDIAKLLHEVSRGLVEQPDGIRLASVFTADVHRNETIIVTEGQPPLKLNEQNATALLTDLVSTGDEELDRIAAGQLSIFLGQSVLSCMARNYMSSAGGEGSLLMSAGKGEITDMEVRRVDDQIHGPMIDINYRGAKNLVYADLPGEQPFGLDPRTDSLRFDCTIRVPIASLQKEGGYRDYEILRKPQHRLHLEHEKTPGQIVRPPLQDDEERSKQTHIAFCQYGDRMIAPPGLREIESRIDDCRARIPDLGDHVHREPPDNLELSDLAKGHLARLMDPQLFAPIYQYIAQHNAKQENVEVPPDDKMDVTVTRRSSQGKATINVEYRYPMPEGFPDDDTTLHYWEDAPRGDARFDVTMRIRIPEEELISGRPDKFVVVGGPHIERQPLH